MTRMQIARRGLIAALAAGALAPSSASATHNGTCNDLRRDITCPATYFAEHHVDPLLDNLDPIMDLVQQLQDEATERARQALCLYFGLSC